MMPAVKTDEPRKERRLAAKLLFAAGAAVLVFGAFRFVRGVVDVCGVLLSDERLEAASDSFPFGEVPRGERLTHTFRLTNRGNKPVFIRDVVPGCRSCVEVAPFPQGAIEPGQTAEVTGTLLTDHLRGPVHKPMLVKYGRRRSSTLLLYFDATIVEGEPVTMPEEP